MRRLQPSGPAGASLVALLLGLACSESRVAPPVPAASKPAARRAAPDVAESPERRLPGSAVAGRPPVSDLRLPPFPTIDEETPVEEALLVLERRLDLLYRARGQAGTRGGAEAAGGGTPERRLPGSAPEPREPGG